MLIFPWHVSAQSSTATQLNQEGFALLQRGAATAALSTWEKAEQQYKTDRNAEGVTGSQLNQALAEQALGLYPRACRTITQALTLSEALCHGQQGSDTIRLELSAIEPTNVNNIGIRLLGESLRLLGNLEEAKAALTTAQTYWQTHAVEANPVEVRHLELALGSVHQLLAKAAIQDYKRLSIRDLQVRNETLERINLESTQSATYYRAATASDDTALATKARLNLIGLFADSEGAIAGLSVLPQLEVAAQEAYTHLSLDAFEQLPRLDAIYGQLKLARHFLDHGERLDNQSSVEGADFWKAIQTADIETLIVNATAEAQALRNSRALAFAYGIAADLKVQQGVPAQTASRQYTEALSLAQSVQAHDISFRLAYKLAKLTQATGNTSLAIEYYQSAISALSSVRDDLIAVNSELRFSFKEEVEPVYRDYIQRLVAGASPDLAQAVTVHQSLQLAQLENFLRCGRLVTAAEKRDTATIHLINLGDMIEVIVTLNHETHGYSVPTETVLRSVESLKTNLQSPSFASVPEAEFLPYAQALYTHLINPAETAGWLPEGVPLSFVLDAPFQSIPMGILHDGHQYLVATHPLSISIQSQRATMAPTRTGSLFAGLSKAAPSFNEPQGLRGIAPLPETEFEATALNDYVRSTTLLNESFTRENLGKAMARADYEIVHISTHGQFSSIPEQTFLLAWDELIDFPEIAQIFQQAGSTDLLFLSACQTAAGDERSALGLAGLAIQSGAHSAIASLWLQDSTGSSVLVDRFYKGLATGRLSKAEALQQAQIVLMESSAFSHPYYWAPFVLVAS
ncbi:MAG: CHAT domain-containing protein [Cyanobacteria bacterium J06555_13]